MRARARLAILVAAVSIASGCASQRGGGATEPRGPVRMAEFWVEPNGPRDLYWGPWGREHAPNPQAIYEFEKADQGGFSPKWDVKDPRGREWSVKMGPEAQAEVTASRILWGVGYHQPPNYYLERWQVKKDGQVGNGSPGRFRPDLEELERKGDWAWRENPFAGTRQHRGLLVLLVMLNSTDLKDDNNSLYELRRPRNGARRWYVVRDVGSSLGETAWTPRRNDIALFERHPFITGVEGGYLTFQDGGRHTALLERLRPEDAAWIGGRLQRLTPRQWQDAFRAGGYDTPTAERYIRRIREKIDQGLAVARAQ